MSFAFPLALLGLVTVPLLVAIYWLRNRSRRHVVSSLMLWMNQRQLKEGGLLIHRFQTPLLFFLELLCILLIVMAAAGPLVRAGRSAGPLTIVLDDSFSMLAGGEDSARNKAISAARSEIKSTNGTVRVVLAGEKAQLLGELSDDPKQTESLLEQWKCYSAGSDLDEAIGFSFSIGGDRSRVLVLTDHAPPAEIQTERLEWRSFGRRRPNLAFVNATRSARDGDDRCLLEVANLSDRAVRTELLIETAPAFEPDGFQELRRSQLELPANGSQRVVLTLAPGAGALRARLGTDALLIDNEVILLPGKEDPTRIRLDVKNEALRQIVATAVRATTRAELVESNANLLITDGAESDNNAQEWVCRIVPDTDAESYLGPFVMDRNHPLSEGLSLDGVVWGAGKNGNIRGLPVITAGNIPLISDLERAGGSHELRISFRPDLSTLQRTPAWPILIWNLLSWRAGELPGIHQPNIRLGGDARIRCQAGINTVAVVGPSGTPREMAVVNRTVSCQPEAPGVYQASAGSAKYFFASNALRREESDLSSSGSGGWGSLDGEIGGERELRNVASLFLLIVLLALFVHMVLVSQEMAKSRSGEVAHSVGVVGARTELGFKSPRV